MTHLPDPEWRSLVLCEPRRDTPVPTAQAQPDEQWLLYWEGRFHIPPRYTSRLIGGGCLWNDRPLHAIRVVLTNIGAIILALTLLGYCLGRFE